MKQAISVYLPKLRCSFFRVKREKAAKFIIKTIVETILMNTALLPQISLEQRENHHQNYESCFSI